MSEKTFKITRGILDSHPRELIISEDFIKFEDKDRIGNEFATFPKGEIAEYNFGINWMEHYFVFGREYVIRIRNSEGRQIKINFKTYFGRKKKVYNKLWSEILGALWENFFYDISEDFIKKHESGEEFRIGEVQIVPEGIIFKTNSSLKIKPALLPWEKVRTKDYHTYFAIYAVDDAATTNRGYSYKNEWNTMVLLHVIPKLLKLKNIQN